MNFLIIGILIFFSCVDKNQKSLSSTIPCVNRQVYVPIWVRKAIDENNLVLSEKEIETLALLDIDGDSQTDAIFVKNNSLVFIDKKNGDLNLTEIKDHEGEVLDDYSWVDFWYVDDPLKSNVFPFVDSKGQVLILGKESSGIIAIYYNDIFQWVSFD